MNSLPFGFISDMYGPHFLILFGCVIVAVWAMCWWFVRSSDKTADLPPVQIPESPDAYDIAYLRGGENEVLRVLIFDLVQRGYLEAVEEKTGIFAKEQKLVKKFNHPDPRHLTEIGRKVFQSFSASRSAQEVFQSSSLPDVVQGWCSGYEKGQRSDQLLSSDEMRAKAGVVGLVGGAVIVPLGGYKLVTALSKGHSNVMFLILMAVIGVGILVWICRPRRLSSRGRRYLERIQQKFDRLQRRTTFYRLGQYVAGQASQTSRRQDPVETGPMAVLGVALFGAAVLAGTPYGYFHDMFQQSSSGGGCGGGGCGGGGGGGGGGCGGCGGCGG